jgi:stage II sporulation protein AA (anti-sigma F factor antagonist)
VESEQETLSISTSVEGRLATITIAGELDLLGAPSVRDVIDGLGEVAEMEVDLGRLSFIDSSGLNALLSASRRQQEREGTLRVVAASEVVLRLFEVAGVRDLLGPPVERVEP